MFRIIVRIDDREVLTNTLDDEISIGSPNSLLLIGGLPNHLVTNSDELKNFATSNSFIGCLSDFQYNYEFVLLIKKNVCFYN